MISFAQKFYLANLLFQAKQALVVKAMYQTAFLAREKGLHFGRWLSDFESFELWTFLEKSHVDQIAI